MVDLWLKYTHTYSHRKRGRQRQREGRKERIPKGFIKAVMKLWV